MAKFLGKRIQLGSSGAISGVYGMTTKSVDEMLRGVSLTIHTVAQMVRDSYRMKNGKKKTRDKDFSLVDHAHQKSSEGYLYRSGNQFVVAFPGTVVTRPGDLAPDIGIALQSLFPNFSKLIVERRMRYAEQVFIDLSFKYGLTPENTLLTGHSLGGAEVRYIAERHPFKAVVFSAPNHPSLKGDRGESLIAEIQRNGDPIATFGGEDAHLELPGDGGLFSPLKNHSIDGMTKALKKERTMEGPLRVDDLLPSMT